MIGAMDECGTLLYDGPMPGWAKYQRLLAREEKDAAKAERQVAPDAGERSRDVRVRLPADLVERCDAARGEQSIAAFVREAIERELRYREQTLG